MKCFTKSTLIFTFMLYTFMMYAQQDNGTITGQVVTSDNQPASFINVVILDNHKGSVTNNDGRFFIGHVEPGTYTLEFSLIGLETKLVEVMVEPNETTHVDNITLNEDIKKLDEVVIVAQRLNQFAQKNTPYVNRLPLTNMDNPQSYTVVSKDLMNEQLSTDLSSTLKSITGGGYVEANAGAVSLYARGFRGDVRVKNGLKMHNRARTPIEHQNLERVEVIKGPSALTYGSGFYGGLVNVVTKKPLTTDKLEVSYNLGSFNLHRVTADFNKATGKNQEYRFRVNGAFHTEDGFQEKGSEIRKRYFIAPAFTYQPSDKFSITLEAEFLKSKRNLNFARGLGRGVTVSSWDEIKWDYNNSYNSKDLAADIDRITVQMNADYKLSRNWTSQTGVSHSNFGAEGPYFRLTALSDTEIQRTFLAFDPEKGGSTNIRQDFIGDFKFDNLEYSTLVGASYYRGFWNFTQQVGTKGFFIPIDQKDLAKGETFDNLTSATIDGITDFKVQDVETSDYTLSGYFNNSLTINNMVTLLGGLRYDAFTNKSTVRNEKEGTDGYDQGKISYNAGISINPIDDQVSLFANYMNGFNNKGPGLNEKGELQNFDPEEAIQWEVGTKLRLFDGKLKSTISYYNINIDNAILNFRKPGAAPYLTQDGRVESKGFEADIIANPFTGFNLVAGYTYNDAKNIKYSNPKAEGQRLTLSPQVVSNIWGSYKFSRGFLKGLGLGLGANHMSKIYEVRSVDNTFWANPYTTVDGTIFYQQQKYRIGLKVNNITNQEYYNAYGIPQKTANFVLGVTYQFL